MSRTLTVCKPLIPSKSFLEYEQERNLYWSKLLNIWRSKLLASFPGCNPVSLSRRNASIIEGRRYLLTLKSDGVRYVLFLTMRPGGSEPVALMIDRSGAMYEVQVTAPDSYFVKNTVLEGELVWSHPESTHMLFLVFDAVCIKGECLTIAPFEERMRRAAECTRWSEDLSKEINQDSIDNPCTETIDPRVLELDAIVMTHFDPPISMRPKTFVDLQYAEVLWEDKDVAQHRVDGLILQDGDAPYEMGTARTFSALKWKDHCTVDLSGPADCLCMADGELDGSLCGFSVEVIPSRIPSSEGKVTEYLLSPHATDSDVVTLFAIRMRPDKKVPNGRKVVEATVRDMFDALPLSELKQKGMPQTF